MRLFDVSREFYKGFTIVSQNSRRLRALLEQQELLRAEQARLERKLRKVKVELCEVEAEVFLKSQLQLTTSDDDQPED